MILGFKTQFPNGQPTGFEEKILAGEKIHSMRLGQRWQPGMSIQMATGVRTSAYRQFNADRPDLQRCVSVQDFIICEYRREKGRGMPQMHLVVREAWGDTHDIPWGKEEIAADRANGRFTPLYGGILEHGTSGRFDYISRNDGLSREQLCDWFRPRMLQAPSKTLTGQIIHWTDFRY